MRGYVRVADLPDWSMASITDPNARDPAAEYLEVGVDQLIDNEALDVIPVVSTLRKLFKGSLGIREQYLTKKLVRLIYGVGPHSERDLSRWRDRIKREAPNLTEVGERLLMIIDNVASMKKAELIGKAFRRDRDSEIERILSLE